MFTIIQADFGFKVETNPLICGFVSQLLMIPRLEVTCSTHKISIHQTMCLLEFFVFFSALMFDTYLNMGMKI